MTATRHRSAARRMTAVARLILATTVVLAAGAAVLTGSTGTHDPSLPPTLVRPAAASAP